MTIVESNKRIIPVRVLIAVDKVRDSGLTNMFDAHTVCSLTRMYDKWAYVWLKIYCLSNKHLHTHSENYSNILKQFSSYLKVKNDLAESMRLDK